MPGAKAAEAERREQVLRAAAEVATKRGLASLTIREVALRAQLSPGLVLFHFGSKDELVLALVDWVLASTTVLRVGPDIANLDAPLERLLALIRQEMARLASEPAHIRLIFDFWSAGIWNRAIRVRMRRELERYRHAFRPIVAEVLAAEPDRFPGVTVDGLVAVSVGFIKGCALQAMIEPHLDIGAFLDAVEALIAQRAASTAP